MTDRYHPHNPAYPQSQWNPTDQQTSQYSTPTSHYPSQSYHSPSHSRNHSSSAHSLSPAFVSTTSQPTEPAYQNAYFGVAGPYTPSSPNMAQPLHGAINQTAAPVRSPRQSHSHTQSYPHVQMQSYSPPSHSHIHSHTRPRAHSHAHPYIPPQSTAQLPALSSQHITTYPPQIPFGQTMTMTSQYPASPTRPFSCDMCALSFNRQHDLKRHRETHTGEKPFLCNGGCGKTFTRKDALKRHQLVKGCGKIEEAWP